MSATTTRSELAIVRLSATRDRVVLPTARTFLRSRVAATIPLLLASSLVFGWRAILLVLFTMLLCWSAQGVWRWLTDSDEEFGPWRVSSILLALMLPTSAAALPFETVAGSSRFIVPAAAMLFLLTSLIRLRIRRPVIEPVILTILLLHTFFPTSMTSHRVLAADALGIYNLFDESRAPLPASIWFRDVGGGPVIERVSAMDELDRYMSSGRDESLSVSTFLLERMPSLEDLVIGGHPTPMGQVGAIYALAGALVMSWRGVIDLRTPMLFLIAFYAAILLLPIPGFLTQNSIDALQHGFRESSPGFETGLTFANYILLSSPAVFAACFVATLPTVEPIARGARLFWSPLAGIGSAIATLYFDVATGAYLALLFAGMLSPWFDWFFGPRPRRRLI